MVVRSHLLNSPYAIMLYISSVFFMGDRDTQIIPFKGDHLLFY